MNVHVLQALDNPKWKIYIYMLKSPTLSHQIQSLSLSLSLSKSRSNRHLPGHGFQISSLLISSSLFTQTLGTLSQGWQFFPTSLNPPLPAWVFPTLQRWWGEDGARFQPHITGQEWVQTFQTHPTPSRPRPTLRY